MSLKINIFKDAILSSISEIRKLKDNEELLRKLKTVGTQEEILTIVWSAEYG